MPTHRHLSHELGIGVGTVTKAYAEAERLGLVAGTVGRGTFISAAGSPAARSVDGEAIDLTMNLPSLRPAAGRLAQTLARLRRRPDIEGYAGSAPHAGIDWHRQAAAEWLARTARFDAVDWRRLVICTGAQHAMALALGQVCGPGDTVLTEAVTFHGMRALAEHRGYRLMGLPMDREGLLPEALERAAAQTQAKALYVQPTLQNPTARSMSRARREAIARVARQCGLWILEAGIYAPLAFGGGAAGQDLVQQDLVPQGLVPQGLVPLAALAPERSFYASSVSKALAPGLRAGFLVAPDAARFAGICRAMGATSYSACALGPLVAAQWMRDGTADEILGEVRREAIGRAALAREILGDAMEPPSFPASLHAWLPLGELEAERIAGEALRRGVALTPPAALAVAGEHEAGLRLCLCAAPDLPHFERALRILAAVLAGTDAGASRSVI